MTNGGVKDIWKQVAIALGSALFAVIVTLIAGLPAFIEKNAPYTQDKKDIETKLKYHDRQLRAIRKTLKEIETRVHSNQIMLIQIHTRIDVPKTLERYQHKLDREGQDE